MLSLSGEKMDLPKKILVVDDYVDFPRLLVNRLNAEGFETFTAYDGVSAIEQVKTLKPDLVILDIMMPEVGGTEVRLELLKDPATRDIPIIFLTGLRAPHAKSKPQNHSSKIIGKSRDFKELLDAIHEELNKVKLRQL